MKTWKKTPSAEAGTGEEPAARGGGDKRLLGFTSKDISGFVTQLIAFQGGLRMNFLAGPGEEVM